jgi:CMP-N,N'-diacetyllegionaminic acid synthase
MKILAIVPARGGSKSIPLKNIKKFCGKPLIVHSIETALNSPSVHRVVVSTDSKEIASISEKAGAEVPFLRPHEFALDNTPDLPVFVHCLEWLQENEGYEPDIVVQLRPTSPLRSVKMVEDAIRLMRGEPEADSVRAVCDPSQNPFKMWEIKSDGYLTPLVKTEIVEQYNQPRQRLPQVYWQNGYIDVVRRRTIMEKHSMTGDRILPLIVDSENIIDIDNELTFHIAEMMFERNKENL